MHRCLCFLACSALALVGQEAAPSTLALPLNLNLEPVLATLEKKVPVTPPGVETWMPLSSPKGAFFRYNLYREPLLKQLQDNRITIRTTAHYWVQVGAKGWRSVRTVGSCGLGEEGHRKVVIGTKAEVGLTPQWGLELKVSADEFQALVPCQVTFLDYDITDRVIGVMKGFLLKATTGIENKLESSALIRQKVEWLWGMLQRPIPLAEGAWLTLNPEHIRMGPWSSRGSELTLVPELRVRPMLSLGTAPNPEPKPLPPLEPSPRNAQSTFKVGLDADLSFAHASNFLAKRMVGQRFKAKRGHFEIAEAAVRGEKGRAVVDLRFTGKVEGRITLQGKPRFDAATGILRLEDLDYTLESQNWIASVGEWFYRTEVKQMLQDRAAFSLEKGLKVARDLAQAGLNRPLGRGATLRGNLADLSFGQPQVAEEGFRVRATLKGHAEVDLDSAVFLGSGR